MSVGVVIMVDAAGEFDAPGPRPAHPGRHPDPSSQFRLVTSLRLFAQQSRDGIVVIDGSGKVVEWNAAQERICGIPRADAIGRSMWEVQYRLAPAGRRTAQFLEQAREKVLRGLQEGARLERDLEDEIERPDGSRRLVHSLLFGIVRGKRMFACAICRDVTTMRRSESAARRRLARLGQLVESQGMELDRRDQRLRKLAAELVQAEERERCRISELLHDDLQQRIAAACYQVDRLQRLAEREPDLMEAVHRLNVLLRTAIDTTRSISHELTPDGLQQTDLPGVLRLLAHRMETDHGLRVAVEIGQDVNPSEVGLQVFLLRTTQELLFNVVKHARTGAAVMRLRRRGRYIRLSVSDLGRGFRQEGPGGPTGTGLLRIGQRAELLGGRVSVSSRPGAGSVVHVVVQDDGPIATTSPAEPPPHTTGGQEA
ncbi:MAG: PAS domain S-box protein [Candidatus Krumholzibacteriia bacterium]